MTGVRKRALGATGLEVSELGVGTWGLSGDAYGPVREADAERVIDRAVALGLNLFETAPAYGSGAMEKLLGKRLPAKTTHVMTKLGLMVDDGYPARDFGRRALEEAFQRSQDRLRRRVIDVVLLHNPSLATMATDEPFELLHDLQDRGQLIAWGVSAGSLPVARAAARRGAQVVQMAFNAFFSLDLNAFAADWWSEDTDEEETDDAAKDDPSKDDAAKSGEQADDAKDSSDDSDDDADSDTTPKPARPAMIARSVLAHGLLAGQWSADREFYPGDHRAERWNPDELRRRVGQLNALRPLVGADIPSLRAVALRYVLETEVSAAVLGVRNAHQLDQLVREAGRKPPYISEHALTQLQRRLVTLGIAS